jgi:hypothetical protein
MTGERLMYLHLVVVLVVVEAVMEVEVACLI